MRLALIHGFTQTGRSWEPITSRLPPGVECVCPDVPGHGTKAAIRATVDDGAAILAREVGPAAWVGYSMGGRLCLSVALDHPEVVTHLVLVSTTPGIRDDRERTQRVQEDEGRARELEAQGIDAFIDNWLAAPMWRTLSRHNAGIDYRRANTVEGLASSLRLAGTGSQSPQWDRLREINAPVLVVTGDSDAKFTEIGDEMQRYLSHVDRVHIHAGHAVPWEQPDVFVRSLEDWLNR
jgi:2-succinyl-6-hydroxy-2,4-cyclohexadiene-1-carboxylate synthase